ncbi:type II toxin-antitoxin system RelE/ParE family toxin [Enterovirga rhinocerotis]|uniref:Plasmid stabilization system protein ParE n=1 Tax=Enterovirga rhinocerotis TaxID=1339210 RepID=A0A4R7C6K5_9HYPH|nr:type II toxin-antitoxin system RelE/ParE family toxin [Enterovirga rhinocerotis]TDR93763.1 plasmid stabilization system protein ParE [Enterovirga rhinocerotis]
MKVRWSPEAVGDLKRLHGFLAKVNPLAAVRTLRRLESAPDRLIAHPRIGRRLEVEPAAREVRSFFERQYEMRYEIQGETIYILRVWHGREDR